jgi:hypothetical protein
VAASRPFLRAVNLGRHAAALCLTPMIAATAAISLGWVALALCGRGGNNPAISRIIALEIMPAFMLLQLRGAGEHQPLDRALPDLVIFDAPTNRQIVPQRAARCVDFGSQEFAEPHVAQAINVLPFHATIDRTQAKISNPHCGFRRSDRRDGRAHCDHAYCDLVPRQLGRASAATDGNQPGLAASP